MRTVGMMVIIVGGIFLGMGLYSSLSTTEEVVEAVSGQDRKLPTIYLLGGVVLLLCGGAVLLSTDRKKP